MVLVVCSMRLGKMRGWVMGGKSGSLSFRRRRLESRLRAVAALEAEMAASGGTGQMAAESVAVVAPVPGSSLVVGASPAASGAVLAPWEGPDELADWRLASALAHGDPDEVVEWGPCR